MVEVIVTCTPKTGGGRSASLSYLSTFYCALAVLFVIYSVPNMWHHIVQYSFAQKPSLQMCEVIFLHTTYKHIMSFFILILKFLSLNTKEAQLLSAAWHQTTPPPSLKWLTIYIFFFLNNFWFLGGPVKYSSPKYYFRQCFWNILHMGRGGQKRINNELNRVQWYHRLYIKSMVVSRPDAKYYLSLPRRSSVMLIYENQLFFK